MILNHFYLHFQQADPYAVFLATCVKLHLSDLSIYKPFHPQIKNTVKLNIIYVDKWNNKWDL